MGRREFSISRHNQYGLAWNIQFAREVARWLVTWDHDGIECECGACEGIVYSLRALESYQWPAAEVTRIVGWLRFREPPWRKAAPAYYRRRSTRVNAWYKRALDRLVAADAADADHFS